MKNNNKILKYCKNVKIVSQFLTALPRQRGTRKCGQELYYIMYEMMMREEGDEEENNNE